MATVSTTRATLDDLYLTEGKAELVDGRIVPLMATGVRPNQVAGNIFVDLKAYERTSLRGHAFTDNMGFAVPKLLSRRESFSPDVSWYEGTLPANLMRFIQGPPTLAVEVRSEFDYTRSADLAIQQKREEYFEAGTLVVWDVDPIAETVTAYRNTAPATPATFHRGDLADAEPAVPGWRIALDVVFA